MKLEIGTYILDINKDSTKKFYKSYHEITRNCNFSSCRNYLLAINSFPIEIKDLFEKLGIKTHFRARLPWLLNEKNTY